MKPIVFIDLEISKEGNIDDCGAIYDDGSKFHHNNSHKFCKFIKSATFVCGHNIFAHDLRYISDFINRHSFEYIDTLLLSPLLYPKKKLHALLKDDKLITESLNNPLNDSIKARNLFYQEVEEFKILDVKLKSILGTLLFRIKEFSGFFKYVEWSKTTSLNTDILEFFEGKICGSTDIESLINNYPIELGYALALIACDDKYENIPGWVQKNYPNIDIVINTLRGLGCGKCSYCLEKYDPVKRLNEIFGHKEFRRFGDNEDPLQEQAVRAALNGESILTIFPTGGGKSISFQLPALIAGEATKGLTVVISPLQSLMKDQVDGLESRNIIDAVSINGLLDPISRMEALERVKDGRASILYIAPESLRSKTIEKYLISRKIERFVIDEAHCFSTWGQDFRVDYLFIGEYIKNLEKAKGNGCKIPISCFTATAKQKVISDIVDYFKEKLGLELVKIATTATRKNLHYRVELKNNDQEKYSSLRELLLSRNCPTIVYVSRTGLAEKLATRLCNDKIEALCFHGKLDRQVKIEMQNKFINDEVRVIIATSAFGMGVDKKDVGLVVHYEISNSLENYVQEAGRGGRGENTEAECVVFYNEEDLNGHFQLLTQTKLNIDDIRKVWKGIKQLSGHRTSFTCSPLELARASGWEEEIDGIETLIKTAVNALEDSGYIKRGLNSPRVFATAINVKNVPEAEELMIKSKIFSEEEITNAKRIISSLIGKKMRSNAGNDDAESRIDYLADTLGLNKVDVIEIVNKMRQIKILNDNCDMSAMTKLEPSKIFAELERLGNLELYMANRLAGETTLLELKKFNGEALNDGIKRSTVKNIRTILFYWMISKIIKKTLKTSDNAYKVEFEILSPKLLLEVIEKRLELARFVAEYLLDRIENDKIIKFSMVEILNSYNDRNDLFSGVRKATIEELRDAIIYLSKLNLISIEGGFLVLYNAMSIERKVTDNKILYKKEDYNKISEHYNLKVQQIHMVGAYANMMLSSYDDAMQYVKDYFELEYNDFINKYFKKSKKAIEKNITQSKYEQLFGSLSIDQKKIIDNNTNQYITVLAGPGSGKTKLLVHKLASLLLLEDVKSEQLLMLTFSRAAALEFKERLIKLIGNPAYYVDIKTFHSYCFDILGKLGDETMFDEVVENAIEIIKTGDVEQSKISKSVLVIDEAQDMTKEEYLLLEILIEHNPQMKVIAVGDDDQSIYEFRKASPEYFAKLLTEKEDSINYELLDNYRSVKKIVDFSNKFVKSVKGRMKTNPIRFVRKEAGDVKITQFKNSNLEEPVVMDLLKNYNCDEKNAILTVTNEETYKIMGLLNKHKINAKLIQSSSDFKIYNLIEIRYFLSLLDETSPVVIHSKWDDAINLLKQKYHNSINIEMVLKLLERYKNSVNTIYYNDLKTVFIESNVSDFDEISNSSVVVSTVHKAKGHQFDNVYLILNNVKDFYTNETLRKIYVGITRARNNLYVYCNGKYFESYKNLFPVFFNDKQYSEPEDILIDLTHRDIFLSFYANDKRQTIINKIIPGDKLSYSQNTFYHDIELGRFSQAFKSNIYDVLHEKGYCVVESYVRNVVKWKSKEENSDEISIILPTIHLRRLIQDVEPPKTNEILCPDCNAKMILRTGKNGEFYGCSNFPKCRRTKQV